MAPKSARREKEDRLSSLPDSLLLHILSFLDMKEVVCTGILSNRWRKLWTSLPNLYFRDYFEASDEDHFVRFVDRTLVCHRASKIHKFHLSCKNHDSSDIDVWICFAVDKGVTELDLDFAKNSSNSKNSYYKLPCWLFKCETLVSLKLSGCRMNVPRFARFSSLTELSLSKMNVSGKMLPDLLAACPLLEDLVMGNCTFTSCLRISSSNSRLKHLTASTYYSCNVEIDAPNLQILNFCGIMFGQCSFKDMPSLVQAKLNLKPCNSSILPSLVQNLRHAKVLELSSYCIEVMNNPTFKDVHSYIFETKYLILKTGLNKIELPGIANLLWSSPNLETLVIELAYAGNDNDYITSKNDSNEMEYWESLTISFPCLVHCLKSIMITNFIQRGTDPCGDNNEETSLVRFLLRNAMILEKITIHACRKPISMKKEEWLEIMLKVSQKLIAIPRASPYVDVLFSYN